MKKLLLCFAFIFVSIFVSAQVNFCGHWNPSQYGWHGAIDIYLEEGKLCLRMLTEEGEKVFQDVTFNESEPSIEWSYNDVIHAHWYIGTWSETKRKEIIFNYNGVYGTTGVPTKVYNEGIHADHMKQCWKYFAVLSKGVLKIKYACELEFYSATDELLFTKQNKDMPTLIYSK